MSEKNSSKTSLQNSRPRVRTVLNYNYQFERYERNTQPSVTIPDQSMSVREILDRYARGLPVEGFKVPIYDEENDLPDPKTLDLAERQEIAETLRQELSDIKERTTKKPKEPDTPKDPPIPPQPEKKVSGSETTPPGDKDEA